MRKDPLPRSYFLKYSNKPVKIKPFSKKSKKIAKEYLRKINRVLKETKTKAIPIGATALEISGKGDLDFGLYINEEKWDEVLKCLINHFKGIGNLNSKGFARFNGYYKGYEVEIVVKRGESAERDKRLLSYIKSHPNLIKDYEEEKKKYAYSEREYMIKKDKFLRKVMAMILDN